MTFVHDDPEFDALLQIVAERRGIGVALVEKDYWVTHTLWSLHAHGLEVWFKGGTSLSKGFGLIERFSEDLDVKIEPGASTTLPTVANWKSEGTKATAERRAHFERLAREWMVPGARVKLAHPVDSTFRSANIEVDYPSKHQQALAGVLRPFVLLEVGNARVVPFVARDMTSFVHEYLEAENQLEHFDDNRPRAVRCVHPLVTLLEKLDAVMRRQPRTETAPATFVRHFEDAARIARAHDRLPSLADYTSVRALANEMLEQKQIAALPCSQHEAFVPNGAPRWRDIADAHLTIEPMFWGPRLSLAECCMELRAWLDTHIA